MGLFRHAGIAPDKTPTGGAARKKTAATGQPKPKIVKPRVEPPVPPATGNGAAGGNSGRTEDKPPSDYMAALLAKFPEFDPAWPDEIKAKWFSGFETFMKGVSPK